MSPLDERRIRKTLDDGLEYMGIVYPTMASIVGQIDHRPMPDGLTDALACATRGRCYYAIGCCDLPIAQLAGLMIHEAFHVVLRHAERAAEMERTAGRLARHTMNVAMDLIINTMILGTEETALGGHISLPPGGVTVASMKAKADGAVAASDYAVKRGLKTWDDVAECDVETVYVVMHEGGVRQDEDPMSLDVIAEATDDADPAAEEALTGLHVSLAASLATLAGSDTGGMVSGLFARIPKPTVPWKHHLRSLLLKETSTRRRDTWSERSRRMASMPAGTVSLPGRAKTRSPRIVAIIDTSGSISDQTIAAFMGEVSGVATTVKCTVTLIEADTEVARVTEVKKAFKGLEPLADAGRGGTNFDPALQAADAMAPSVIVYLTDLLAAPPKRKPKAPVLWCAVGGAPSMPFGRRVQMPLTVKG